MLLHVPKDSLDLAANALEDRLATVGFSGEVASLERSLVKLNRGDSRIAIVLIQGVGWEEVSMGWRIRRICGTG
jgi:hypothetical protein